MNSELEKIYEEIRELDPNRYDDAVEDLIFGIINLDHFMVKYGIPKESVLWELHRLGKISSSKYRNLCKKLKDKYKETSSKVRKYAKRISILITSLVSILLLCRSMVMVVYYTIPYPLLLIPAVGICIGIVGKIVKHYKEVERVLDW